MTDQAQALNQAIDQFQASYTDTVISVSRVINPLLAIWDLANSVDHVIAAPVEALLVALTGRQITTGTELAATMDALRTALAELVAV